jgi:hypothetical protein
MQVYSEDINQNNLNTDKKTEEAKIYAEDITDNETEESAEYNKKQEETV